MNHLQAALDDLVRWVRTTPLTADQREDVFTRLTRLRDAMQPEPKEES